MIIPISHESNQVRRLPWISFLIILLCFIIHISIQNETDDITGQLKFKIRQYFFYLSTHPYLEVDQSVKEKLNVKNSAIRKLKMYFNYRNDSPPADDVIKQEQEEFDWMGRELIRLAESIPYNKWGFIPVEKKPDKLITYMFIHGGWLHLIGNLLLLYLTGPYLEDAWGRVVYPVFYIFAGVFSAAMYMLRFPVMNIPLIGASGAIAGLMGAFLVKFWNTKIKFFYFFFFGIFGTFKAPAWIMLPLWFGFEAFDASQVSKMNTGGSGVAHHVHVWGFVLGVGVALILKLTGIESRYLSKKIDEKLSFKDEAFDLYEKAKDLFDNGEAEKGFDFALDAVKKFPSNQELVEFMWNTGSELKRREQVVPYMKLLIESEIIRGKNDLALSHYGELKRESPKEGVGLSYELSLIEYLLKREDIDWAPEITVSSIEKITGSIPPGLLSRLVLLVISSPLLKEKNGAQLRLKIEHLSGIESSLKNDVLKQLDAAGISTENVRRDSQEKKKAVFKVYPAVIRGLSKEKIILLFGKDSLKSIPITSIKGVSVWRISSGETNPDQAMPILDLFIDTFSPRSESIGVLRIDIRRIDPLKFVPKANDSLHAVKIIISFLIRSSGAEPIPDAEVTGLLRFQDFRSREEYENYLRLLLKSRID